MVNTVLVVWVHGANGKRSENHQLFAPERMLPFTCLHEYKRIVDAGFVQHCKYQAYICKKAVEFCCRSSQEGRGFEFA